MPSSYHPPEHPFGSVFLKLRRANIHLKALRRSMRGVRLPPEVSMRKRGVLDLPRKAAGMVFEGASVHRMAIDPVLPRHDDWGLIVGDVVGNLRQSLDHIAWALAMTHAERRGVSLSDKEAKGVYFPICTTEEKFRDSGLRNITSIMPEACTAIEAFQPYHRREWRDLELLAFLDTLANRDKHRVATLIFREVGVSLEQPDSGFRMRLNHPGHVDVLITDSIAAKMGDDFRPKVTDAAIVLDVGAPFTFLPMEDLPRMRDFIRDKVMPAFVGFVE